MKRTRRKPHPQLHLPPLDGHQALLFVAICERLIAAVWRAHGDAMTDLLLEPLTHRLVSPPLDDLRTDDLRTDDPF